jgi:hypothetical protein
MNRLYYYIMSILLISLACCKRDNNAPQIFTKNSYPLAVGNWWQYQLTAQGYQDDTFMLSVISMSDSGAYIKYNCNFIGNGTTAPAGYFLISDTSMSFTNAFEPYYSGFQNFYLKFPVATGQYWQGSFPGDSIVVISVVNSYSAYGHTYSPCYYTKEAYDLPHNFKVSSMIYTPKVGLIEGAINFISDTADRSPSYSGGVQIQQSILLLDYHVQ